MKGVYNQWLYPGRNACIALFSTLLSNAVLHHKLLEKGLSIYQLGLIGAAENFSNILCLLLLSGLSDSFHQFRNYRRVLSGMMMILPLK